jgi:YidC/Oxa1 family membrane protein insertase
MINFFHIVFYQPIFNALIFLYNIVPGNDVGIAIVILTLIIRFALYPLNKKSIQSQKALQDLQPKMEEIKQKYANDKQEQGRAMMELYKNEKVNPFSSCLPLLIQLPFLIAVYYVFQAGLTDTSSLSLVYGFINRPESINPVTLGFFDLSKVSPVLAVLAGLAQFWQAKMMVAKRPPKIVRATPGAKDEDMMAIMNKQMVYFMPAITVFIGLSFPAGLTLYWLITTLFTALQQMYLFKNAGPSPQSPTERL